MIMHN